jgi:primosomal protein N'
MELEELSHQQERMKQVPKTWTWNWRGQQCDLCAWTQRWFWTPERTVYRVFLPSLACSGETTEGRQIVTRWLCCGLSILTYDCTERVTV